MENYKIPLNDGVYWICGVKGFAILNASNFYKKCSWVASPLWDGTFQNIIKIDDIKVEQKKSDLFTEFNFNDWEITTTMNFYKKEFGIEFVEVFSQDIGFGSDREETALPSYTFYRLGGDEESSYKGSFLSVMKVLKNRLKSSKELFKKLGFSKFSFMGSSDQRDRVYKKLLIKGGEPFLEGNDGFIIHL